MGGAAEGGAAEGGAAEGGAIMKARCPSEWLS